MSNSFNPFAPASTPAAAQPAPVQSAPVAQPVQTQSTQLQQRVIPRTFADVAAQPEGNGFHKPWFYEQPGEFDVQIIGYTTDVGDMKGPRIIITVKVLTSTNPAVAVGFEGRIGYKFDFEKNQRSLLDQFGYDLEALVGFVAALYQKSKGQVQQDDELRLRTHDWAVQPGYVHLSATLGKPKDSKKSPGAKVQFRRDRWLPVKAA